jgi:hypothetical protein
MNYLRNKFNSWLLKKLKCKLLELSKNDNFIGNVCLTMRHDYGMLSAIEKRSLQYECRQWILAILGNMR